MFALELIYAGLEALQDYIALHVITCLGRGHGHLYFQRDHYLLFRECGE